MSLLDKFLNNIKIEKRIETGQKIKRIRLRNKTAVSELAEAAGVNEAAIRNYEVGYRQISRDKLELIAQRLGVPVETLVDRQHGTTKGANGRTGISHKPNCKSGWMRSLCSVKKTNPRQKKLNPVIQTLNAFWG